MKGEEAFKSLWFAMINEILETSIFVRVLLFAVISVLTVNVVTALVNLGMNIYIRSKGIR